MSHPFKIIVTSIPDRERLIAEIYISDLFIGFISEERGIGIFDFEFSPRLDGGAIHVDFNIFQSALTAAKDHLLEMGTEDQS